MAAPTISTRDPSAGATNVVRNKVIKIVFDQALLQSTVTPVNFGLRHSASNMPIQVAVSYDSATFTVSLQPEIILPANTTFKVTVIGADTALPTGAVQNTSSESFAVTATWTFSTGNDIDAGQGKSNALEAAEGDLRLPAGVQVNAIAEFQLVSTTPPNGSWGFTGNTITLEFNRQVSADAISGNVSVYQRPFLDEWGWMASGDTTNGWTFEWQSDQSTDNPFGLPVWQVTSVTTGAAPWKVVLTNTGQILRNVAYEVVVGTNMTDTGNIKIDAEYAVNFTSASYPDYISPRTVRNELFTIFDTLNLEFVHQLCWKWMVDGFRIAGFNIGQFASSGHGIQEKGRNLKKFATYGAVLDILRAYYYEKSLKAGQTKTLGDFTVSYHPKSADISKDSVFNDLKRRFDEARRAIAHSRHTMRIFIKGWDSNFEPPNFRLRLWKNPRTMRNPWPAVIPADEPVANTSSQRDSKLPGIGELWS